ncbi:MAG: tetratricopeptide repeat protein [Acidimicrobiales bacterium]
MTSSEVQDLLTSGDGLMDARKFDQALQLARRAVTIQPVNPSALALVGRALIELARYDKAVEATSEAVSLAPQWADAYRLLAVALLEKPGLARSRGLKAVDAARTSVRLGPRRLGKPRRPGRSVGLSRQPQARRPGHQEGPGTRTSPRKNLVISKLGSDQGPKLGRNLGCRPPGPCDRFQKLRGHKQPRSRVAPPGRVDCWGRGVP